MLHPSLSAMDGASIEGEGERLVGQSNRQENMGEENVREENIGRNSVSYFLLPHFLV
jgi:hypothetical protein